MELTDLIAQMGGLQSMARELGVSESQAASGAASLLPSVLGGFKKQAQAAPQGFDLGGLLGQLGGGALLDNVIAKEPTDVSKGNDVLGTIFGSKDVSRAVAQQASAQSGLDPSILKKMLPMVAMVVTGFLAKQRAAAPSQPAPAGGLGGLGGLLGGLLGGNRPATGGGGGLGALASMLDANGDGNPLDDVIRMMGRR